MAGARPEAVLVDFGSEILAQGPQSKDRPYRWSDLLDAREGVDLAWSVRDAKLFARIMVGEFLPSLNQRFEIRCKLMDGLNDRHVEHKRHARYLLWNWETNGGGQLNRPLQAPEIALPPNGPPLPGTWRCDPVNRLYLQRFLDLAAAYQISVSWLLPPTHPGHQVTSNSGVKTSLFVKFLHEMLDRSPNVVVIDGRHSGYERTAFIDMVHLNRDGATTYTANLAEVISPHGAGGSVGARWVKLPDYRKALAQSVKKGSEASRDGDRSFESRTSTVNRPSLILSSLRLP